MSKQKKSKYHSTFRHFRYTVMLFILIPMLLLGAFIIISYSNNLYKDLEEKRELAYDKVVSDVSNQFEEIDTMRRLFTYEGDLRAFLIRDEVVAEGQSTYGDNFDYAGLALERVYQSGTYSAKMSVWSFKNDYIMSYKDNCGYGAAIQPEWYKRYQADGSTDLLFAEGNNMIVTKSLNDPFITGQTVGMLILEYNKNNFIQDLRLDRHVCDMAVKIYSNNGEEVFSSGDVEVSCTKAKDYKLANARIEVEFGKKDETTIIWKILSYLVVCTLLCLAIAYIVSSSCAKILYKSVKNVFSKMGNAGEPSIDIADERYIAGDENKDMEEKLAKLLDKMQSMQLSSLQLQINPHFVFNVLNYVNLKIQRGDETKESQMIMLLCKILSYAMSEPKYSAKIVEEIKMTEKYIEIEKIKSNNAFDVEWDIDKSVLDKECIKLFLQPIVENSIMHGLKGLKDRRGRIDITISKEPDGVCFTVEDNGVGMTSGELSEVRARLGASYDDSSKHIGLRNVNERIKMVYGKKYGVQIESDGQGTKVTMKIGNNKKNNAK